MTFYKRDGRQRSSSHAGNQYPQRSCDSACAANKKIRLMGGRKLLQKLTSLNSYPGKIKLFKQRNCPKTQEHCWLTQNSSGRIATQFSNVHHSKDTYSCHLGMIFSMSCPIFLNLADPVTTEGLQLELILEFESQYRTAVDDAYCPPLHTLETDTIIVSN